MTALTHVELVWLKDRIENRIRFGPIAEQHVLDRSRQLMSLEPARFCLCPLGLVGLADREIE